MHLKGLCNLIWAASTARRSAFQETDIDTYLAFTYINTVFFCTLRARYFGLAKLIQVGEVVVLSERDVVLLTTKVRASP